MGASALECRRAHIVRIGGVVERADTGVAESLTVLTPVDRSHGLLLVFCASSDVRDLATVPLS